MRYVYDFDVGSVLFLGLTIFFYLRQRRLRNISDRIYTVMLISAMVAVVFDFVASAADAYALLHPRWFFFAVNILFMLGMQTCLPLFFLYAAVSSGAFRDAPTKRRILFSMPFLLTVLLILSSPFIPFGIFTIDGQNLYRRGPSNIVLYINMGFYVITGGVLLLKKGRSIQRLQRNVVIACIMLLFASVVLQVYMERYLLTASATALALTAMFYAIQSPVDQLDPVTGAFSRTQLPALLDDYHKRGRPCTMLLHLLRSFDEFTRLYGASAGNELLRKYASVLMRKFENDVVIYMDAGEFIVVRAGVVTREELETLQNETPAAIAADGKTVSANVRVGAVPCLSGDNPAACIRTADYMIHRLRISSSTDAPYADGSYKATSNAVMRVEAGVGRFLSERSHALKYSRILGADGNVAAEEARLKLPDVEGLPISYARFFEAVSKGGHVWRYYETLLSELENLSGDYGPDKRLCLTVLPALLVEDDSAEKLSKLLSLHGFPPSSVLFSMSETDLAPALGTIAEKIQGLADSGFLFMVDTFAEGYTDLSMLASLPLRFARLNESLVRDAQSNARSAALFSGLIGVLRDMNIEAVCPGVETEDERKAVLHAGAAYFEGAFTGGAA